MERPPNDRETQFRKHIPRRNLQTRFEIFSINPQEPGCRSQVNRWCGFCGADKPRGIVEDGKARGIHPRGEGTRAPLRRLGRGPGWDHQYLLSLKNPKCSRTAHLLPPLTRFSAPPSEPSISRELCLHIVFLTSSPSIHFLTPSAWI